MDLINISKLDLFPIEITRNDFFPLVDSRSLTTFQATINTFENWLEISGTVLLSPTTSRATWASSSEYARNVLFSNTTSYLYYTGSFPINGTASYALNSGYTETASFLGNPEQFSGSYAINVFSASWASSSISSSYISASNIEGIILSASYAITSSYAITASNVVTSSYAIFASNVESSSYTHFAKNLSTVIPFNLYGPFTADPSTTAPFVPWGLYDRSKRSVAFILDESSDIIVKCIVNYSNYKVSSGTNQVRYLGAKLVQEGQPSPIASKIKNNELNTFCFASIRDIDGDGNMDGTAELIFNVNGLDIGQYRVYIMPLNISEPIAPESATSASNDQIPSYNSFYNTAIATDVGSNLDINFRIYNFLNAVQVFVYSRKNVRQGLYPTSVTTWKKWKLGYRVSNAIIINGLAEFQYQYTSTLVDGGTSVAYWVGPDGPPGWQNVIYLCLPSDHVPILPYGWPKEVVTPPTITDESCIPV